MSMVPYTGVCMSCGHDHGGGVGSQSFRPHISAPLPAAPAPTRATAEQEAEIDAAVKAGRITFEPGWEEPRPASTEGEKFRLHLQWASDEVATWPAWKQRVATPAPTEQATTDINAVYDFMGIGSQARSLHTLMADLRNMSHFADLLHAIEREFFRVPGEPDEEFPDEEPQDECLLNCWGSTQAQYIEQFRAALAARQVPDSRAAALTESQIRTIKFAADALEGLDYEDTAGDLRAIAQEKAQ